ncbi:MAG: AraC family transcriptional regulator [Clostridia bacterium]|nr:AraC family transcriptional regulator [Clostridia bacterium]
MAVIMDYFLTVSCIIIYIENRIHEKINYKELERATGFSIAHIRDIFVMKTGITLSKYILTRKISNAAYEILHNSQSVISVATKYGFANHDTFTRAFKRITGLTPSEFRKKRPTVGRIKLCACVFGVGLLNSMKREDDTHE